MHNSFSLNMVSEPYNSLGILGLGFCHVVNSGDQSNDCASLQLYYSCCKASQEPQPPSEQPVAGKFFLQDFLATLRLVDTPLGLSKPELPAGEKSQTADP